MHFIYYLANAIWLDNINDYGDGYNGDGFGGCNGEGDSYSNGDGYGDGIGYSYGDGENCGDGYAYNYRI